MSLKTTNRWIHKMDNKPTLETINNFISLINSEDFEATIISLSHNCNVPIEYTRQVMLQILNNTILSSCIDTEDYDSDSYFMEEFEVNKKNVTKELLSGKYDSLIWTIDFHVLDSEDNQLLALSELEYGAIQSLGNDKSTFLTSRIYEKKVVNI